MNLEAQEQIASSWNDDLVDNPNGSYKFSSFSFTVHPQMKMTNRQTYGLLDWLGDIGGLIDALFYLVKFLLRPFLSFNYARFMMTTFFRANKIDPESFSSIKTEDKLKHVLSKNARITSFSFLPYFLNRFCSKRRSDYK